MAVLLGLFMNVTVGIDKCFPPDFKFGVATAAYQIEGAWNVSDKGESIWDRAVHSHPELVAGGINGDVTCDSYHNWRRDVEMVHEMGLHFYRFSISWSRLLPNAFPSKISESGKRYYNDLIDYLLEKGIEPVVVMYHWDLPQKLQDLGGWTNPLISDWFADYATVVFELFADRVKTWITINEPNMMCDVNYNTAMFAPLILETEIAALLCNKHVLVAHAKAWRIYDKEFKPRYHGKMSIGNNVLWIEAKTDSDEEAAELARQSCIGQYSHPIYSKEGGWPPTVERAMAEYSRQAGYPRSKLPAFTKQEILLVRGTYDFYGINYYTGRLARRAKPGEKPGYWIFEGHPEFKIVLEVDPRWPVQGPTQAPSYPAGLRYSIAWLRDQYGDLDFFVTENGCSTIEDKNDRKRMEYIKVHLEHILFSMKEDGANITGYTYWSLMDSFEWMSGYKLKFGLYSVDFSDPLRRRTARASAHYYSRVARERSLRAPARQPPPPRAHRSNGQHTRLEHHTHRPRNNAPNDNITSKHLTYLFSLVSAFYYLLFSYDLNFLKRCARNA